MVFKARLEVEMVYQIDPEDFSLEAIKLEFIEYLDLRGSQKLVHLDYWLLVVK